MISKSNNILIISYFFPPISGMTSIRAYEIAKSLKNTGYNVDIITIKSNYNCKSLPNDYKLYDDINIFNIIRLNPGYIYNHELFNNVDNDNIYKSNIRRKIKKYLSLFVFPDGAFEWIINFIFNYKIIKKRKYQCIISFGYPYSSHIIGFISHILLNTRWIADYGELWSINKNKKNALKFKIYISNKIEKYIIKRTSKIVVVNEEMRIAFEKNFPYFSKSHIKVISHGYNEEKYKKERNINNNNNIFSITYTGTIWPEQSINNFIKAINILHREDKINIKIFLIGRFPKNVISNIKNEKLYKTIFISGYKNHNDIVKHQTTATILLILGANNKFQIASKIVEYIGACRPILNISYNEEGATEKIVKFLNRGFIVNNNILNIRKSILELYKLWRSNTLNNRFNLSIIDEFKWEYLGNKYSDLISEQK